MSGGRLHIGPLEWVLDLPATAEVSYSDPAYDGFWTWGSESVPLRPLCSVPLTVRRESRQIPSGEPLYRGGKNWALWEQGDALIFCSGFYEKPAARFYCEVARDFSAVQLFIDPSREGAGSDLLDAPLRYPIDQILSWGMLARCGGLILHSAVAVKDGVGWVISGRSGAGKSTLSELCHDAGWTILNDDRVMVFKREGQWRVAGTPWHGSGRFSEAAEVPLGGLFFIEKSDRDFAEAMPPEKVRYSLLDVAAVPWFEDRWSQGALDAADQFAREGSFYRLEFTKSPTAVAVVDACRAQGAEVGS